MRKSKSAYLGKIVVFMVVMLTLSSYSTRNTNTGNTASSASATFVTCPTTTVQAVAISGFAFLPNSVTIAVNDIVTWASIDNTFHTVTSGMPGAPDGKFDSGNIAQNAEVCAQFLASYSYQYYCNIHPFMTGTVTIQ